jgi:hypothetical protein
MAKVDDAEEKVIAAALEILLTPDGKGKKRKAVMLSELCCTMNPNKLREHIANLIETNQLT